ncbi:hypothetical protein [Bradyrhizobium niftali]|uniref:TnsA endonuclease N-terminal domain-containing protein n=1 Tax=Bradyrhizobium niftali TaxID=2560055 RepID=A0A4Y9LPX4_9BRAD|nr:hypothetical protein [Bradyrhizobium niftali]TFV44504.1 hypothetical protein E4K65_27890 [Bradyrhizobium niftali]
MATGRDHARGNRALRTLLPSELRRRRSARIQIRNLLENFTSTSEKLSQFAVQLLLDPAIPAVNFIRGLPFLKREVPIDMLCVNTEASGRVAFDVLSERRYWDLDHEGLVQLTLQHHRIRLVEVDRADIDAEPRASNCKLIWSHRDHPVPTPLEKAITRALTAHPGLTARSLGDMIGVRDPRPEISALICQGMLVTDLSVKFGPSSALRLVPNPWRPPTRLEWLKGSERPARDG